MKNSNLENQLKQRYEYIDAARGIVIILMLIGHSSLSGRGLHLIYGFHMPFFFILSGYLYNREKWEKAGFTVLLRSKIKSYVVPYFILAFVNLLINIPMDIYKGVEIAPATLAHIGWIISSTGNVANSPNCGPLWFLPCAFLSNIYLYWVFKIKKGSVRLLIACAAVGFNVVLNYYSVPFLPWHIEIAMIGMVFMIIGYEIRRLDLLHKKIDILLIGIIVMAAVYCIWTNEKIDLNTRKLNNIYLMFSGATAMSFAVIWLCLKYNIKNTFLTLMGKNTILIMAFNYVISVC